MKRYFYLWQSPSISFFARAFFLHLFLSAFCNCLLVLVAAHVIVSVAAASAVVICKCKRRRYENASLFCSVSFYFYFHFHLVQRCSGTMLKPERETIHAAVRALYIVLYLNQTH